MTSEIEAGDLEAEILQRERAQSGERRREEWLKAVESLDTLPDSADVAPAQATTHDRTVQITLRWSAEYETLRELDALGFEEVVVKPAGVDRLVVKATYPLDSERSRRS